ncbi:MAG: ribonuclease HII [Caldilineales bacterium]
MKAPRFGPGAGATLRLVYFWNFKSVSQRPTLDFERALWQIGVQNVAGVDEAGRGAWAGPVVAGAVVLPDRADAAAALDEVNDSKQLSATLRERLYDRITAHAVFWATGSASAAEIDTVGILPATRLAMQRAVAGLACQPQHLLIDHVRLPALLVAQQSITRGDSLSLSIAAASILAKVTRDRLMIDAEQTWPGYGFARHKGYGTAEHIRQLRLLGPCPIHRTSFQPVRGWQMALLPGLAGSER